MSVSVARVHVVAERKRCSNPPRETAGAKHVAVMKVLERIGELKQAGRKQRRAMKPCILETVVIRGNVNKYTDRDVKLETRRRKSVPKEKE